MSASFLDYDRDGWLDLYVGNYVNYGSTPTTKCHGASGEPRLLHSAGIPAPSRDRLYRNQGDGTFVDVSAAALAGGQFGPALGVSTADFNNDGWIDIYVANDGEANLLWINQRDGTFRDVALLAGAALSAEGKPEGSMGVDAGDFDNDGDEDLFMTQLPDEGNNLYVNDGSGMFEDQSARSGARSAQPRLHRLRHRVVRLRQRRVARPPGRQWRGVAQADRAASDRFPYNERERVCSAISRNGRFEDVTSGAGAVFQLSEVSRGASFGDIDNDGDTDVLVDEQQRTGAAARQRHRSAAVIGLDCGWSGPESRAT